MFICRKGMDAEGVYSLWNQVAQYCINLTVPHDRRFAGKLRADNGQEEMPAAAVASVPLMQGAIIADVQLDWLQSGESAADFFYQSHVVCGVRLARSCETVSL